MIYEPTLNDGEPRDQYLERFARMNRPAWTFMTEESGSRSRLHRRRLCRPSSKTRPSYSDDAMVAIAALFS